MILGQYKNIRCTTCGGNIQIWDPKEIPERCPACGVYFGDMLAKQGGGTGLTTSSTFIDYEGTNTD